MRVLITGAAGNLGSKLIAHLQSVDWCTGIVAIDPRPIASAGKLTAVIADLRDTTEHGWINEVTLADAIVHFAAQNPAPDSNWLEAAQSLDMTLNLLNRAGDRSCRFVFASSNHVLGGYKDAPLPPGQLLSGATPPLPGTRTFDGTSHYTPHAYGSSKLMGERAVAARANASAGQCTGVNVRIGWVQPGDNRPATIGVHGGGTNSGPGQPDAQDVARSLRWFRAMWLSNRDFVQLMERAILAPATGWPAQSIVVSGVSNNSGTLWDHSAGRHLLDYQPIDDVAAS